jgi:hypothetical protein
VNSFKLQATNNCIQVNAKRNYRYGPNTVHYVIDADIVLLISCFHTSFSERFMEKVLDVGTFS